MADESVHSQTFSDTTPEAAIEHVPAYALSNPQNALNGISVEDTSNITKLDVVKTQRIERNQTRHACHVEHPVLTFNGRGSKSVITGVGASNSNSNRLKPEQKPHREASVNVSNLNSSRLEQVRKHDKEGINDSLNNNNTRSESVLDPDEDATIAALNSNSHHPEQILNKDNGVIIDAPNHNSNCSESVFNPDNVDNVVASNSQIRHSEQIANKDNAVIIDAYDSKHNHTETVINNAILIDSNRNSTLQKVILNPGNVDSINASNRNSNRSVPVFNSENEAIFDASDSKSKIMKLLLNRGKKVIVGAANNNSELALNMSNEAIAGTADSNSLPAPVLNPDNATVGDAITKDNRRPETVLNSDNESFLNDSNSNSKCPVPVLYPDKETIVDESNSISNRPEPVFKPDNKAIDHVETNSNRPETLFKPYSAVICYASTGYCNCLQPVVNPDSGAIVCASKSNSNHLDIELNPSYETITGASKKDFNISETLINPNNEDIANESNTNDIINVSNSNNNCTVPDLNSGNKWKTYLGAENISDTTIDGGDSTEDLERLRFLGNLDTANISQLSIGEMHCETKIIKNKQNNGKSDLRETRRNQVSDIEIMEKRTINFHSDVELEFQTNSVSSDIGTDNLEHKLDRMERLDAPGVEAGATIVSSSSKDSKQRTTLEIMTEPVEDTASNKTVRRSTRKTRKNDEEQKIRSLHGKILNSYGRAQRRNGKSTGTNSRTGHSATTSFNRRQSADQIVPQKTEAEQENTADYKGARQKTQIVTSASAGANDSRLSYIHLHTSRGQEGSRRPDGTSSTLTRQGGGDREGHSEANGGEGDELHKRVFGIISLKFTINSRTEFAPNPPLAGAQTGLSVELQDFQRLIRFFRINDFLFLYRAVASNTLYFHTGNRTNNEVIDVVNKFKDRLKSLCYARYFGSFVNLEEIVHPDDLVLSFALVAINAPAHNVPNTIMFA